MNNPFKKAERKRAWLKFAITGPSGSGKTMSSLKLMRGLVGPTGKIALIDTENDSASLYSDVTEFDSLNINAPYTTEKYIAAIKSAIDNKYDGIVIDTISHAWAAEGGLLDQKEAIDSRGGKGEQNKFTNWSKITKKHEEFKSLLINSQIHMICTMRSKQDYVLGEGNKPQKIGMAPVQREGMEYEFTTVFDLAMNHSAVASKDRTNLFDQKIFTITEETGKSILAWQDAGKPLEPPKWSPSPEQIKTIKTIAADSGYTGVSASELLQARYGLTSSKELTKDQYDDLCKYMEAYPVTKLDSGELDSEPT